MIPDRSIQVEQTAEGWVAHYTHPLLGFIDGRGPTKQMALSKWRERLREVVRTESAARYERLRQRFPGFFGKEVA